MPSSKAADLARRSGIAAGLAISASLAQCLPAIAQDAPLKPTTPEWDMIAFEVKSWGAPISSWRVLSNGGGSWTETVRAKDAAYSDYQLAWHEIEPDPENYITLEKLLRRLPKPVPDSQQCESFLPDMAYGTIRLTRGATTIEIEWNDGCMDESYRAFMAILKQADEHMQGLGKVAPVTRTESPPTGG
ncbi:hypothetical protein [Altererythrobacter sp. Z27]|uniref:hypothetical protein n=1 Tax=Altererythrobacter sp. Z27 TaxID=3461147 RepID=UPI00404462A1